MNKKIFGVFICLSLCIFTVIILLISPVFYITHIEITGNDKLKRENILSSLDLTYNSVNLFAFSSRKAKKILLNNPYVEKIDIYKTVPNKIEIKITERIVRGYVPHLNSYLYIDGDGLVLETKSVMSEKLPLLVGLEFDQVSVGKILQVSNEASFEILFDLGKTLEKYELYDKVTSVDISDKSNIHIFVNNNNLDINFGKYEDADWKISAIKEILKDFDEAYKGQLLIGKKRENIVFVPYK